MVQFLFSRIFMYISSPLHWFSIGDHPLSFTTPEARLDLRYTKVVSENGERTFIHTNNLFSFLSDSGQSSCCLESEERIKEVPSSGQNGTLFTYVWKDDSIISPVMKYFILLNVSHHYRIVLDSLQSETNLTKLTLISCTLLTMY